MILKNSIIRTKYCTNVTTERILSLFMEDIKSLKPDSYYDLYVSDFIKRFNIKNKNAYNDIEKAVDKLVDINVFSENRDLIDYKPFFIHCKYNRHEGYLSLKMNPLLYDEFTNVNSSYTRISFENTLKLKTKYQIRMYNILKSFQYQDTFEIDVYKLIDYLAIEMSNFRYNDFKKRVLTSSQNAINELTDIKFKFDEIKFGRKVVKLRISIINNNNNDSSEKRAKNGFINYERQQTPKSIDIIKSHIFPKHQSFIKKTFSPSYITYYHKKALSAQRTGQLKKSFGGFLYYSIVNDTDNYIQKKRREKNIVDKKKDLGFKLKHQLHTYDKFYEDSEKIYNNFSHTEKIKYKNMISDEMKSNKFLSIDDMAIMILNNERLKASK